MKTKTIKPTPGPWAIGKISKCDGGQPDSLAVWPAAALKNEGKRGPAICLVAPALMATEEDEANAVLLAAAPDLLKACRYALDVFAGNAEPTRKGLKSIEDAIAKTEWRSI